MPHCPTCGETVEASQTFCQGCGCALQERPSSQSRSVTDGTDDPSGIRIADEHGEYVTAERVAKVSEILDDDESVHFLTRGSTVDIEGSSAGRSLFGDDRSRKSGTRGYVRAAITDRRVAVKVPQWLGDDERSVPYDAITSVDLDTGLINKRLSLQTPGQTYHVEVHEPGKEECRRAVRFVRRRITETKRELNAPEPSSPDPTPQLRNLKDLHDDGVVTDEEFEEKRRELLDEL